MLYRGEPSQAEKDRMFYIGALKSNQCQCDRPKQPERAVCYKCWMRLTDDLRRALYKRIGGGFEKAYDEACGYLNE